VCDFHAHTLRVTPASRMPPLWPTCMVRESGLSFQQIPKASTGMAAMTWRKPCMPWQKHTHKAFKRLLCFTLLSFFYTHILSVSVSSSELLFSVRTQVAVRLLSSSLKLLPVSFISGPSPVPKQLSCHSKSVCHVVVVVVVVFVVVVCL